MEINLRVPNLSERVTDAKKEDVSQGFFCRLLRQRDTGDGYGQHFRVLG